MKPIKLTIVGYLFNGVIYSSREAWNYAKEQYAEQLESIKERIEKAKNHSLLAKAIKLLVREERLKEAKESLRKFGYSFKRWVELAKAKTEYAIFVSGLSNDAKKELLSI